MECKACNGRTLIDRKENKIMSIIARAKIAFQKKQIPRIDSLKTCDVCSKPLYIKEVINGRELIQHLSFVPTYTGYLCTDCGAIHNPIIKTERIGDDKTNVIKNERRDGFKEVILNCERCNMAPCPHMSQDMSCDWIVSIS